MTPYPFDLGSHTRATSTPSEQAQAWFDRGLLWCYAFNHEEAIRCFERAAADDPGFALAHWGIAFAVGPNYNKDWEVFPDEDLRRSLRRAHQEVTTARELAVHASPVERDLITALAARFPAPDRSTTSCRGRSPTPTRWRRSTPRTPTTWTSSRSTRTP